MQRVHFQRDYAKSMLRGHNHCALTEEDIKGDYRVKARHDAVNVIEAVRFRLRGPPGG